MKWLGSAKPQRAAITETGSSPAVRSARARASRRVLTNPATVSPLSSKRRCRVRTERPCPCATSAGVRSGRLRLLSIHRTTAARRSESGSGSGTDPAAAGPDRPRSASRAAETRWSAAVRADATAAGDNSSAVRASTSR
ncbi:hypothetical protein ADL00_42125 [Streptomyces sp. AS58]|nr:hypothetical protein ADL00_42125 [Streptomyces sp. AS58]